jgi:hypothetical protein
MEITLAKDVSNSSTDKRAEFGGSSARVVFSIRRLRLLVTHKFNGQRTMY